MNPVFKHRQGKEKRESQFLLFEAAEKQNVTKFIHHGETFLYDPEMHELGNVSGKSLLHLHCRCGLGTLSLARMGATVVGVDSNEHAILLAKNAAHEAKLSADFICSDIYNLHQRLPGKTFQIVFMSYGFLCWQSNLLAWGQLVAHFLAPGGICYLVDFHPEAMTLEDNDSQSTCLAPRKIYPYEHLLFCNKSRSSTRAPFEFHGHYIYNYKYSDVTNALIDAGLTLVSTHEYNAMYIQWFKDMSQNQQGYWEWTSQDNRPPLLISFKAVKPIQVPTADQTVSAAQQIHSDDL